MVDLKEETGASPECRAAWRRIGEFVMSGLLGAEHVALREHLDQCEECMQHYRDALQTTSRVGRAKRDEREEEQRVALEEKTRTRLASVESQPVRTNWNRLRTILYPAFFIFLMVLATRGPRSGKAGVLLLSGAAVAADSEVTDERLPIGRGDWCATGAASRVQLDIHKLTVILGADTRVSIEALQPPRLRFAAGHIEPNGTCTISTSLGVIELQEATATLWLGEAGLEVLLHSGTGVISGAAGDDALMKGGIFRVRL